MNSNLEISKLSTESTRRLPCDSSFIKTCINDLPQNPENHSPHFSVQSPSAKSRIQPHQPQK